MPDVSSEQVLVVPTRLLHDLGYFQGFLPGVAGYLDTLLSPQHTSYRPRAEMEVNPHFKQLIPYVLFCYTRPSGQPSVFRYTRGTGQGEQRLHRKQSVGIGGHVSKDDNHAGEPYAEGMRRELDEEVLIRTPYSDRCVGLINDDQTEVGQVHLGVVHVFDVETPDVVPRETEIIDAGFCPVGELLADLTGFESWSQICLQALFGQPGPAAPAREASADSRS
jgi:predicted NUDIX family phosphoesterase